MRAPLKRARKAAAQALGVAPGDVVVAVKERRNRTGRPCKFTDDEIRHAVISAPSIKAAARALPLADGALRRHIKRLGLTPHTLQGAVRDGVAVVVGDKVRSAMEPKKRRNGR